MPQLRQVQQGEGIAIVLQPNEIHVLLLPSKGGADVSSILSHSIVPVNALGLLQAVLTGPPRLHPISRVSVAENRLGTVFSARLSPTVLLSMAIRMMPPVAPGGGPDRRGTMATSISPGGTSMLEVTTVRLRFTDSSRNRQTDHPIKPLHVTREPVPASWPHGFCVSSTFIKHPAWDGRLRSMVVIRWDGPGLRSARAAGDRETLQVRRLRRRRPGPVPAHAEPGIQ